MKIPFVKDQKAFIEAVKEFGRLILIGAVSGGLTAATVAVGLVHDPIVAGGLLAFLTFVGKAWDKYIHKSDANSVETGLTGF